MRQSFNNRRGISLVETLIAMSTWSVLLTVSATLLHHVMRSHSESRQFAETEQAACDLSRQFRQDVQAALSAEQKSEIELVTLQMPDSSQVDYVISPEGVSRYQTKGDQPNRTEFYPFAGAADWKVSINREPDDETYVTLHSGHTTKPRSADELPTRKLTPPVYVHVEARLTGARLSVGAIP